MLPLESLGLAVEVEAEVQILHFSVVDVQVTVSPLHEVTTTTLVGEEEGLGADLHHHHVLDNLVV